MKIGLLDQYTGENLGDAAILESAIHGMRRHFPGADIVLFSLYPEGARRRHGLPSHALVGWRIPWYSDFSYLEKRARKSEGRSASADGGGGLKARIKSTPILFAAAKGVRDALSPVMGPIRRWVVAPLANFLRECAHIVRSWRILRDFDLMVVSGGGQLDDEYGGAWGHPYSLLKWGLLARATGTRFVFLSVGACALGSSLSRKFIGRALRLASYRSYRDARSKQTLESLFDFTRDDSVQPDLAFAYPAREIAGDPTGDAQPGTVGVSPILYLSDGWPRRDPVLYARYKSELARVIALLAARGHRVVLFQSDDNDIGVIDELMRELEGSHPSAVAHVVAAKVATLDELMKVIAPMDALVVSRLHGILLAHLLDKPVVALSYDAKVTTHMTYMEQLDYCLDIHTFRAEEVIAKLAAAEAERAAIQKSIRARSGEFAVRVDRQYEALAHG